eukprot:3689528-Rhodomonas_salina.1
MKRRRRRARMRKKAEEKESEKAKESRRFRLCVQNRTNRFEVTRFEVTKADEDTHAIAHKSLLHGRRSKLRREALIGHGNEDRVREERARRGRARDAGAISGVDLLSEGSGSSDLHYFQKAGLRFR